MCLSQLLKRLLADREAAAVLGVKMQPAAAQDSLKLLQTDRRLAQRKLEIRHPRAAALRADIRPNAPALVVPSIPSRGLANGNGDLAMLDSDRNAPDFGHWQLTAPIRSLVPRLHFVPR